MDTHVWIYQMVFTFLTAASATELLPERYLKPQDFNHHPFTDVGIPASLKKVSTNPYAILAQKRPREGREFPIQSVVYYPTPHRSVLSKKQIETNEISKYDESYVPKNYAFSYTVKDQHSGDDFSHSQAHNGKATRGQYRVKLPDGRTQIVSYTADHKGYRADVQYEDELTSKPLSKPLFHSVRNIPETPVKLPEILPNTYQNYHVGYIPKHIHPVPAKALAEVVYAVTPSYTAEENYVSSKSTVAPVQYVVDGSLKVIKPTVQDQYYQPQFSTNVISTTPASYHQEQYISSTGSPQYLPQNYISSNQLSSVEQTLTTVTPQTYQQERYHNYLPISSTVSSQHAVIVTPRPIYNQGVGKH